MSRPVRLGDVSGRGVVRVGRGDDAQIVGVGSEPSRLLHPGCQYVPIVVVRRHTSEPQDAARSGSARASRGRLVVDLLEVAEFVGRTGQRRAGRTLHAPLVLIDLHQGFEPGAQHRSLLAILSRVGAGVIRHEHATPAEVRIVGDRQDVAVGVGLQTPALQPVPELSGTRGFEGRERTIGDVVVAEDHVAVQIVRIADVRIFVTNQGRERTGLAAVVGIFGGALDALPDVRRARGTARPVLAADLGESRGLRRDQVRAPLDELVAAGLAHAPAEVGLGALSTTEALDGRPRAIRFAPLTGFATMPEGRCHDICCVHTVFHATHTPLVLAPSGSHHPSGSVSARCTSVRESRGLSPVESLSERDVPRERRERR